MEEIKNAHKISARVPRGKRPLVTHRQKRLDNI
jgi:hypothetical protein